MAEIKKLLNEDSTNEVEHVILEESVGNVKKHNMYISRALPTKL